MEQATESSERGAAYVDKMTPEEKKRLWEYSRQASREHRRTMEFTLVEDD